MNKKNVFLAVAFVAVAATACIIVACTKDKGSQTSTQAYSQPFFKNTTPFEALNSDIRYCWDLLEDAFVLDSGAFLYYCDNDNMSSFLSMTGLTASFLSRTDTHALMEKPIAQALLGTSWLSGWVCRDCLYGGLPTLGQNVRELHNILEDLSCYNVNSTPCFALYIDSCVVRCYQNNPMIQLSQQQRYLCWINCVISRDIVRARNILNALSMGDD